MRSSLRREDTAPYPLTDLTPRIAFPLQRCTTLTLLHGLNSQVVSGTKCGLSRWGWLASRSPCLAVQGFPSPLSCSAQLSCAAISLSLQRFTKSAAVTTLSEAIRLANWCMHRSAKRPRARSSPPGPAPQDPCR